MRLGPTAGPPTTPNDDLMINDGGKHGVKKHGASRPFTRRFPPPRLLLGDPPPAAPGGERRANALLPANISAAGDGRGGMEGRDKVKGAGNDRKVQREDAKAALNEAFEEMKKVELLDERDQMRERSEEETRVGPEALGRMGSSARA